jgi:hypothetical protein
MLFVLGAGGILIAAAACFNLARSRFIVVAPATGGEP